MIFSPNQTAKILAAIQSVMLGNNGYADIGVDPIVAQAVADAGFVVIATRDLHGKAIYRGFSKAAQAALAIEPFGASTYKPFKTRVETPDYEGAILARNDRHLFA